MEDWVAQARKLQSSGDLFAALAWVAEGLAVHPDDPKLLQIQDAIQRDQGARRRQARRGDLEDLRRMQREIDGAADVAAKQALAERIQAVAAKYWTDGEILSIANALLLRLGLVPQESSSASPRGKGATVILHVPRPSAPEPSPRRYQPGSAKPGYAEPGSAEPGSPSPVSPQNVPAATVPPSIVPPSEVPPSKFRRAKFRPALCRRRKVPTTPPEPQLPAPQAATLPAAEPSAPAAKVTSPSSQPKQPARSNSTTLILISAAAIILVAATFFFTRKHYAPPVAKTPAAAPTVSAPGRLQPRPSQLPRPPVLRSRTNNSRTISACFAHFFRHRRRKSHGR